MTPKISFSYNGINYCLEYNRKTVKMMEDRGFVASRILEAPMSVLPELFAGAFLANHKHTKREIIDEIFDKMQDKSALIELLSQMYNEPIKALMEDGDEGNGIAWMKE